MVACEMQQFLISGNGLIELPDDHHDASRNVPVERGREQKMHHLYSNVLSIIHRILLIKVLEGIVNRC